MPRGLPQVTVGNGFLTVAGSREQEEIDRSKGHFERAFGRFERRIRLPEGVKEEDVVARYESGVIRVELPKVPVEEKERRIEVM